MELHLALAARNLVLRIVVQDRKREAREWLASLLAKVWRNAGSVRAHEHNEQDTGIPSYVQPHRIVVPPLPSSQASQEQDQPMVPVAPILASEQQTRRNRTASLQAPLFSSSTSAAGSGSQPTLTQVPQGPA
jgi:hypothetical protein